MNLKPSRAPDVLGKNRHHVEHLIRVAKELASDGRAGVLATVDREGQPHLRWMSTLSLFEFPCLYALTSPDSRKVEHIRANPKVSWMFSGQGSSVIVNLEGTAKILTEKSEVNRIWNLIENKSNAFFLGLDADAAGVAVIETTIEEIECVVPRYDLHYPSRVGQVPGE